MEPCEKIVKTIRCEPMVFEQQIRGARCGEWQTEQDYVPGPVVCRTHREPGRWEFDRCTCCCRYVPGPVVTCQEQLPGRHLLQEDLLPARRDSHDQVLQDGAEGALRSGAVRRLQGGAGAFDAKVLLHELPDGGRGALQDGDRTRCIQVPECKVHGNATRRAG